MTSREFANSFKDYDNEQLLDEDGKLNEQLSNRIRQVTDGLLKLMLDGLNSEEDRHDLSVYTGSSGVALLFLHLHRVFTDGKNDRFLQDALQHISRPLKHLRGKRLSFLCGDPGPLAIGAVIYHKLKQTQQRNECLTRLCDLHKAVCKDDGLPNELLYGRVGYMYALLFVQRNIEAGCIDSSIITKVLKVLIQNGRNLSRKERSPCPLMFTWHDKHYLGAAHGLAGIFYILLKLDRSHIEDYLPEIKSSIDYMLSLRFPSGNCPSSLESNTTDKLVHWCHGAPGWIHMFLQAYQIFQEEKYLIAAKSCGDVIWSRGILKKGYGLCHGTAGNAYGFLALFKTTREQQYLHRACMFAEWCFSYGKHGCNIPDHPFSLFEGIAGTIHFLTDLLDPVQAKFPAFDI